MTRDQVLDDLRQLSPNNFVSKYIFDSTPFIFRANRDEFVEWKNKLGLELEIDPMCISLVGSSAVGVSLNPNKNFRPFTTESTGDTKPSDVDVAIISPYHFMVAWRFLRNNWKISTTLPAAMKIAWQEHQNNYIYFGTIATDKLLSVLPFAQPWTKGINKMKKIAPTQDIEINLRIYNDYDSLRSYQIRSVKSAKAALLSLEAKDAQIS